MIKDIVNAFVDRKKATILILITILLVGYFSYQNIPKESSPDVQIPVVYVFVRLDGVSVKDSESLILKPLENKLIGINGLKEVTGYAHQDSASVVLEFDADYDINTALSDVRNKVEDAEADMPVEIKKPVINEINLSLMPVLSIALSGDVSTRLLLDVADDLKDKIEGINQVLEVQILGDREEIIEITVEPQILEEYGIPLANIGNIVSSNNRLVATGNINNKQLYYKLDVDSVIDDYFELLDYPVIANGDEIIRFKDIAKVKRTYKDQKEITRTNGNPSVVLQVKKRIGKNIIETVEKVKAVVSNASIPAGVAITFSQDDSQNILDMVSDLENNIIVAIILVIFVIANTVSTRAAALIAISVPASFLAGILMLSSVDVTLNIVVLFSLILTVGMVVDDAIVVSEYADKHNEEGVARSYPNAAIRMFWPVFTSTLVKIVVFLPLLFWPGVLGEFMKFMPLTVIAVLGSSFLYAILFLPSVGGAFAKFSGKEDVAQTTVEQKNETHNNFQPFYMLQYRKLLIWVLHRPRSFIVGIFAFISSMIFLFATIGPGVEFFPDVESPNATISIQSSGNISLLQRDSIMRTTEEILSKYESEVKVYNVIVTAMLEGQRSNDLPKDTLGYVTLELKDWKYRRKAKEVLKDIRRDMDAIAGVSVQITAEKPGPKALKPVEVNIKSENLNIAADYANKLLIAMQQMGNFVDIETNESSRKIAWQVDVDKQLASRHMLSSQDVGTYAQLVTNGVYISRYRPNDSKDELDIILRVPEEYRNLHTVKNMKIATENGNVPLSNFITITPVSLQEEIKHVGRKGTITIKADVSEGVTVDRQMKKIAAWVANNPLPNVEVQFKGDEEDQAETSSFLQSAFGLSLLLMFTIMLVQFNSFYHAAICMSAVFLSTGGVFMGLLLSYQTFGIVMCGVGIIALGGIVLNNNIIFIDAYQHFRWQGMAKHQAIVETGLQRIRPILLTAVTAILGLMPMVIGLTINVMDRELHLDAPSTQWWKQLSTTIAGGLSFATVLTLFLTPALLMLETDEQKNSKADEQKS